MGYVELGSVAHATTGAEVRDPRCRRNCELRTANCAGTLAGDGIAAHAAYSIGHDNDSGSKPFRKMTSEALSTVMRSGDADTLGLLLVSPP